MLVHMVVLISSSVASIVLFKIKPLDINTNNTEMNIIIILLTTIGIPFFVLSTSSTNFQKWYSLIQKDSPYHLYSLSNTGNLLALVGYGLVVEVLLGLQNQILLWNILYGVAVIIGLFIGITVYYKLNTTNFEDTKEQTNKSEKESISCKRKIYWIIISFIPCSLMIATNTVLGNVVNINEIHYFWILPLAIYLVAYIIAFSKLKLPDIAVCEKVTVWLMIVILRIIFVEGNSFIYIVSMLALFMICLVCNLYIVKDTPNKYSLTEFYLYISIGGALGGIFASMISPLVFSNVYEYPIIIVMFLFLMLFKHKKDNIKVFQLEQWEYLGLSLVGISLVVLNGISTDIVFPLCLLIMAYIIRSMYVHQKLRFAALAILILSTSVFDHAILQNYVYQTRNFYGIKTVKNSEYVDKSGSKHELVNLFVGSTLHGSQFEKGSQNEFEALSYYNRDGSTVGRFFTANRSKIKTVGVIGLGVGVLSSLGDEGQTWKYFEIDPQVIDIAKNKKYFTMMAKYQPQVITGDARVTLQAEKDKYYDVLVLDAYSGDMIPASLLTEQAVELYKSKLKDDGIMLFHITNRQVDLKPVLSTVSDALGVKCYVDTIPSIGTVVAATSVWVMLTNNTDLVSKNWVNIEKYKNFEPWTDDKYSLAQVLNN